MESFDKKSSKRTLGSRYEQLAAEYLTRHGMQILERNFRCRQGEIDLIAKDGRYLVFTEVKYRRSIEKGEPAEAVTAAKQQRIRNSAGYYLYKNRYGEDTPCRFDVVSILDSDIRWIKNAF
ncbi:MAG: YraN family protein [Brotaphodocola sp.]